MFLLAGTVPTAVVAVFAWNAFRGPHDWAKVSGPVTCPEALAARVEARVRVEVEFPKQAAFLEEVALKAELASVDSDGVETRLGTFDSCYVQISLANSLADPSLGLTRKIGDPVDGEGESCLAAAVKKATVEDTVNLLPQMSNVHFYYPGDQPSFTIRAGSHIGIASEQGIEDGSWNFACLEVSVNNPSGWKSHQEYLSEWPPTVRITLRRPWVFLLPVGLLLLLLFVAALAIPSAESLGTAMQVAVAVTLLLWTGRTVVLPESAPPFLLLDWAFLVLGVLVVSQTLVSLLSHWWLGIRSASPSAQYLLVDGRRVLHRRGCKYLDRTPPDRIRQVRRRSGSYRPCSRCEKESINLV